MKKSFRVIARLDVKREHLVKGIHLEGLRKLGSPQEFTRKYYADGIDEILYMDVVASLYGRNSLLDLAEVASAYSFVPMTIGGGIRTIQDVGLALEKGADKIAVNTAAIANPSLITEIANTFGSQCMVLSVEAKSTSSGGWEALYNNGREHSGLDALQWVKEGVDRGAGEILITSVDREGTRTGMDLELLCAIHELVSVPVIGSGGVGSICDIVNASQFVDAVAVAHMLHYNIINIVDIKTALSKNSTLVARSL